MALTLDAKEVYDKLSTGAQSRIDDLLKRPGQAVHHSDISRILTDHRWKNLSRHLLGKQSVFEINSFSELNKLLCCPDFFSLWDDSGFIRSLFLTHYSDILSKYDSIGSIDKNAYKNARTKYYQPTLNNRRNSNQIGSAPNSPNVSNVPPTVKSKKTFADNITDLLVNSYNIILHGAPGTGKTYLAKQIAENLNCGKDRVKMVQFHPSYDYTDFMEGLRPVKDASSNIGFERRDGAFKEFCKNAEEDAIKCKAELQSAPIYVFIIDEINRGEIAKIFGECMYSIDPGYLGISGRIDTQYQTLIEDKNKDIYSEGFYRPENVYIIGTMNDIDRGVESMDLAMRRRFLFVEIKAEDTQEQILNLLKDQSLIDIATNKMNALNKEIRETLGLGEDYCIGASYFLKVKDLPADKWENLWERHFKGLLKEYVRGLEEEQKLLIKFKEAYDNAGN